MNAGVKSVCVAIEVYIYIYIYIYMNVWLNNKDTFWLYDFIKILSSFLISVLVSGWNWSMNLPKLSPIPTWNQDTYQETWKDLNKTI